MKILMVWELGRNYGHVAVLADMARALIRKNKKNVEVVFALQTPSAVLPFAEGLDCLLLQAPFYPVRPLKKMLPSPKDRRPRTEENPMLTYADDLRNCGYEDPQALAGLIRAWSDLFKLVNPDVLVAQAAPTALLAARGHKFKTVTLGGSYDIPPKTVPLPLVKQGVKVDPRLLARREEQLLANINKALDLCGRKPVKSMAEMLKADAEFVTMFEELDHYPDRARLEGKPARHLGKFYSLESGQPMSWNKKAAKRILAYIRPDSQGFGQAMAALGRLPKEIDIIVSAPGLPEAVRKAGEKANLRIVSGPVKLAPLLKDCDLGISHASQGISCAFATHGVAQVLLPTHIEQLVFAKALGRNKMGLGVAGRYGPEKVEEVIAKALANAEYKANALKFAQRYKDFKPEKLTEQMAGEIFQLAQGAK